MQNKPRARLWSIEYILAIILNALPVATTSMLVTTLPLFAIDNGGGEADAGLVTTVFTITALLFRPLTGYMVDKRGRKIVMLAGLGITIVACIFYARAISILFLLFLRFFHGIGFSAQSTSGSTILADVVPASRRGEGIGHGGVVASIVAAVGPALGLSIIGSVGFPPLFYTTLGICIAGLIVAIIFKETRGSTFNNDSNTEGSEKMDVLLSKNKKPSFIHKFIEKTSIPVSLVLFFVAISIGGVITFLPAYAETHGIHDISMFFWIYAAALIVSRPLVGWIGKKVGISKLILPGVAVLVGCFVLLGFSKNQEMFLVAGTLYGFGLGLVQPALATIVVSLCPEHRRGVANATFFSTMDLGIAIGAALWGIVAEISGFATIFLASAICIVFSGMAYWFFLRKQILLFRHGGNHSSEASGL